MDVYKWFEQLRSIWRDERTTLRLKVSTPQRRNVESEGDIHTGKEAKAKETKEKQETGKREIETSRW